MTDCTLEASFYHETPELLVTIDTDSWIESEFELNADLDAMLNEFREQLTDDPDSYPDIRRDYRDEPDEGAIMRAFPRYVYDRAMIAYNALPEDDRDREMTPKEPTGFYGEGEPIEVFTPNEENYLSRDLHFVYWADHNGAHVVLRGADAYNGYGHSTAYDALGYDGTECFDYARAQIACDTCDASWSDEPYGHGRDYGEGFGNLPGYRVTDASYDAREGDAGEKGTVVIDTGERHAFCPVCGNGKLIGVKY